jgi:site-specific DNA-cytosine methylase
MNILELHAGSRSIGNAAEKLGLNVFSVDWQKFDNINLVIDIEKLQPSDIPFIPDIIWTSPDCTTYSVAAISHHRNGLMPISDYAKKCDRVNFNQIKLINYFLNINPKLKFFIENPRGMMRKMPFVNGIDRVTVWYCQYGDDRAKPTDIFSNHLFSIFNQNGWIPKHECYNGNKKCHHESAPRGSKTGTQGKNGSYDRSKIPNKLCIDILKSCL